MSFHVCVQELEDVFTGMPAGRAKKPAKAPRAPADEALCPELEDLQGDGGLSGPEDSPGRGSLN